MSERMGHKPYGEGGGKGKGQEAPEVRWAGSRSCQDAGKRAQNDFPKDTESGSVKGWLGRRVLWSLSGPSAGRPGERLP